MFREFYRILINARFESNDLFKYLDLAKSYGKVQENDRSVFVKDATESDWTLSPESPEPIFIKGSADNGTVCAFFENMFILFSVNEKTDDRIIRIYLKRPEDQWIFTDADEGKVCVVKPKNVCAEVYINYDVNVLDLNRCHGEEYLSGTWNKAFYRSLTAFMRSVEGFTEVNRIKRAYK